MHTGSIIFAIVCSISLLFPFILLLCGKPSSKLFIFIDSLLTYRYLYKDCNKGIEYIETSIERFFRLFWTYFVLIVLFGDLLFIAQFGLVIAMPFEWQTYFVVAGLLTFIARVIRIQSCREVEKDFSKDLVYGLFITGLLGAFLACINFCVLMVKNPKVIYEIFSPNIIITEISIVSVIISTLVFFVFPLFLASIGEIIIILKMMIIRKYRSNE